MSFLSGCLNFIWPWICRKYKYYSLCCIWAGQLHVYRFSCVLALSSCVLESCFCKYPVGFHGIVFEFWCSSLRLQAGKSENNGDVQHESELRITIMSGFGFFFSILCSCKNEISWESGPPKLSPHHISVVSEGDVEHEAMNLMLNFTHHGLFSHCSHLLLTHVA